MPEANPNQAHPLNIRNAVAPRPRPRLAIVTGSPSQERVAWAVDPEPPSGRSLQAVDAGQVEMRAPTEAGGFAARKLMLRVYRVSLFEILMRPKSCGSPLRKATAEISYLD